MTCATIGNSAYQSLSNQQLSEIDEFCDRFDLELVKGDGRRIESFLAEAPEAAHDGLLAELLAMELEYRTRQGETPRPDEYAQRFPQQAGVIARVFSGVKIATSADKPTQSALNHPSEQIDTSETIGSLNTIIHVGNQLGPYKLLAKLGEGGMGVVYQARHTRLGKLVALKILPQHLLSRSDALSRFEREMLAVGSLQHPNIIQALDAGEINGAHYLSMEYVEGQDLQQLIQTQGTLSVVAACEAIRQTALGLAAAHQVGLVHRDIKPSNLFVTKQTGQIKILDMGLALLAQAEKPAALTFNGQCFGTPDYMAPEQWSDAHTCDARSDLYSLGCTLYFLLVGRPPYHSETHRSTANKMKGHMLDAIPDLALARPDVPAGVVAIYLKLMAKTPSERFASADELAAALAPWVKALPAASTPATAPATAPTEPVIPPSSPNSSQSSDKLQASPPAALAAPQIQAVATPLAGLGSPPRRPLSRWLLAAGGAAGFALLGVIIITITNKDGTKMQIEVPDTSQVEVTKPLDAANFGVGVVSMDLSGEYVISAKAVEGDSLAIWTYGNIVSYIGPEQTWTLKKLSDDGEQRIYSIEQKGQYLNVKDGQLVPSTTPGQWVVWDNGGLYSIMWYEDATKGANCISLIRNDDGYVPLLEGHAHHALELARNNAGGQGNAHQLWELTKKK